MATKNKSSGSQHNARGITQGSTLVGPQSGLPFDEVVDNQGKRRLAVDAQVTLDNVTVDVDLEVADDGVHIGDVNTGNTLKVEADGSVNANVEIDAADGDNIAIKDSAGHELDINPDGSVNAVVKGAQTPSIFNVTAILANIEYSQAIPNNSKKFRIKARTNAKLELYFASAAADIITVLPGNSYKEENLTTNNLTLYFKSSKAGEVIEILSWV